MRKFYNSWTVSRISIFKAVLESLQHFITTLFHEFWWLNAYLKKYFFEFMMNREKSDLANVQGKFKARDL